MELERLPKEDSTQANKHLTIKNGVPTRRSSTPKQTTVSMNDTGFLPTDGRLTKDLVSNEPQKNGKFDNVQLKTVEKTAPPTVNTIIDKGKARITLPTMQSDININKDSLQKGETTEKPNSVNTIEYAVSKPVEADESTTEDDITNCVGYKATIYDTSLVVCTMSGCNRYFTKMEKFSHHRKREHDTTDVITDIWIFGNVNRGENATNATAKITTESITTPIATEKNVSLPINAPVSPTKIEKTEAPLSSLSENSNRVASTGASRNRKQKELELLTPSSTENTNKRTQDQVPIEDSKKETNGNKRREMQPPQQFLGQSNNEIRQQQQRQQRRYPIEEEQLIGPDGRIRYPPRGNRGQNANPMYGIPYDTGDHRYYAMQIHHMNFGLSPYSELPHPPPPRYDGGYGDIQYSQFYGGGNRRFFNSPPPPPPQQRRSR